MNIGMVLSLPYLTEMAANGSTIFGSTTLPLYAFYGTSIALISFYGGVFSVMPALLADTFGTYNVGAIHGRMLTAWSASALVGPRVLTKVKESANADAVTDLAMRCDPEKFETTFGTPLKEELLTPLIDANTLTIARLMDIAPAGTVDPTPLLYNNAYVALSAFTVGALGCAAALKVPCVSVERSERYP